MFARIKRSGGRAYLVVVENERVYTSPTEPSAHRQRQVARLGRVDHLGVDTQQWIVDTITEALVNVALIRPKHGRGLVRG